MRSRKYKYLHKKKQYRKLFSYLIKIVEYTNVLCCFHYYKISELKFFHIKLLFSSLNLKKFKIFNTKNNVKRVLQKPIANMLNKMSEFNSFILLINLKTLHKD